MWLPAIVLLVLASGCRSTPATFDENRANGRAALRAGRVEQAERYFLDAQRIAENGPAQDKVATILEDLSQLYITREEFGKADAAIRRALAIRASAPAGDALAVARVTDRVAWLAMKQGRFDEALKKYGESLAMVEKALGPDHLRVAEAVERLAQVQVRQRQYDEALKAYERSLRIREALVGPVHEDVADALDRIGQVHLAAARAPDAELVLTRAVSIRETAPADARALAESLRRLGLARQAQRRYDEADGAFRKARAALETSGQVGELQDVLRLVLETHARLLLETGRSEEADTLKDLARAIRDKSTRAAGN